VVDRAHITEYYSASESTLSFLKAVADMLHLRYIYHKKIADDEYHVNVIRRTLTSHIAPFMDDMMDEIDCAFHDEFPVTDGEQYLFIFVYSRMESICCIWKGCNHHGKNFNSIYCRVALMCYYHWKSSNQI
jgi:hypothetical protein